MEPLRSGRTPHALLVPALWAGHFSPFLQIIHQLVTRNIGFTVLTTQKRCDELKEYRANGRYQNVDTEFVPFFRDDSIMLHGEEQMPEKDLETQFEAQIDQLATSKITCLIADMFLGFTEPYAKKWGVPWYSMITTNTSYSLLLLHGQAAVDGGWHPLNPVKKNQFVELPGLEMYTAGELPLGLSLEPQSYSFHSLGMKRATGLLINSFEALEKQRLNTLRSQLLGMAEDSKVPKVLSIGPLLLLPGLSSKGKEKSVEKHRCLQWLDGRHKSSVLFLGFGSCEPMPLSVVREVQRGLESTGVSFLWALRLLPKLSLKDVLPTDFESRTKDRGMVVTEWVPQQEILNHPSTNGFLSHCGWNSILEALFACVPIVACPIFMWAEQAMNARFIVDELEVAVEIKHKGTIGEIDGEEVANALRTIMGTEKNGEIREKMLKLKSSGIEAVAEGGSSQQHLQEFLADISQTNQRS